MIAQSFVGLLLLAPHVLACAGHENHYEVGNRKREMAAPETSSDWTYEASFNWGRVNPEYTLCQTGTQQSPVALSLNDGPAPDHEIEFAYANETTTTGNFYNWGYGPAFTVTHPEGVYTGNPFFTYDNNVTVYLKGWHTHSPAEHAVDGDRSKAELHLVHVDARGRDKAVLAIRLDPGRADDDDDDDDNAFFGQLPPMIGFSDAGVLQQQISVDHGPVALDGALLFSEFWTYQGSLTTPPCHEGIRWFVARRVMYMGVDQMRRVLGASSYSARAQQEVWQHRINQ
ncbi:carbonic anhydrase [Colletotrichum somersetense]|nr:carbonic anhydrase [Colletotrichum somersetense]